MKKLTIRLTKDLDDLIRSLQEVADEIIYEVNQPDPPDAFTEKHVEELCTRYNEIVMEATAFMQSIHDDQENYFNERSEKWQEGDAGQSYESWMDEWNTDLEELDEVDLSEDAAEPEFEAITVLQNLPEQP